GVLLDGDRCDDREMKHVGALKRLEVLHLNLGRQGLTAAGWQQVGKLTALRKLSVYGSGDATGLLKAVSGLKELREVEAPRAVATDADMAPVGRLSRLEVLNLDARNVTGKGLSQLANLSHIRTLLFKNCIVDDLSPVAKWHNLEFLNLGHMSRAQTSA